MNVLGWLGNDRLSSRRLRRNGGVLHVRHGAVLYRKTYNGRLWANFFKYFVTRKTRERESNGGSEVRWETWNFGVSWSCRRARAADAVDGPCRNNRGYLKKQQESVKLGGGQVNDVFWEEKRREAVVRSRDFW